MIAWPLFSPVTVTGKPFTSSVLENLCPGVRDMNTFSLSVVA